MEILKRKSRFVFELVIWTQPSGLLCLWQCFLHISRRILHHTHAICGEFQISPHLSCGDIWNFSTCGEIFNFPTIVIHGKVIFLHMTIFSPLIILVILVTNIRSVYHLVFSHRNKISLWIFDIWLRALKRWMSEEEEKSMKSSLESDIAPSSPYPIRSLSKVFC